MKTRCVIVAGGDRPTELFQKITENDFVIAADSGLKFCLEANVRPDLIVGDFDSFFGALPEGVETVKLPTHKDDTDLLFAARCGVERGLSRFAILGGYGSRPDQNMAMFQTLCWIVEQKEDADATAICNGFEVSVIKNQCKTFKADKNRYLSVFAIDGDAEGVDIIGAEYPLTNATLTANFPIGVSNCAESDTTVSVKNGKLLIMWVDKNI